jgi:hypothetical protein
MQKWHKYQSLMAQLGRSCIQQMERLSPGHKQFDFI